MCRLTDSLDFLVKQRKSPGPNDTAKKKKKGSLSSLERSPIFVKHFLLGISTQ